MTQLYCLNCKQYTETKNVVENFTINNRRQLRGNCIICGRYKCLFVGGKSGEEPELKSKNRITKDRQKRKKAAVKRKVMRLGPDYLKADKETQKRVRMILREAVKPISDTKE